MDNPKYRIRSKVIVVIFFSMFAVLILRVFKIQIVNGSQTVINDGLKIKKEITLKSTRGNIYDRKGNLLAGNRLAYSLTIVDNGSYSGNRERQLTLNSICYRLVKVLKKNQEILEHDLKIDINESGEYVFTIDGTKLNRFRADVFGIAKIKDLNEKQANATADDIINYLASDNQFALYSENKKAYTGEELKKYNLKTTYSNEDIISILGIRYTLFVNSNKKYIPKKIAADISEDTAIYVLENAIHLKGVEVETDSLREYEGGEAFSHVLGYTGKISSEKLEEIQDDSYNTDSVIGKTGIELYLEDVLKGTDGVQEVFVNKKGRIVEENPNSIKPKSGKDVYLSIDKELQIATYQMLEQRIAGILLSNIINTKDFDKSSVKDASDIKIPIYDVYFALINNNIINLKRLQEDNATNLEQKINRLFSRRKEVILNEISQVLTTSNILYKNLSDENKEYLDFIVNNILIKQLELLDTKLIDKNNAIYLSWLNENKSVKEYLTYATQNGWIDLSKLTWKETYINLDEGYNLVVEEIMKALRDDDKFDKLIIKFMLKNDYLDSEDICELLYDQGVLVKDEDYELLVSNKINSYEFIKKKIKNLEITPAQLALDPYSGSAVIVEVNTGKVLACVSYPGYDNNKFANQIDSKYFNQLANDLSLPLYNRATQQLTAPGSTFKPITIIAGLTENVITPNTSIVCDGIFDKVQPHLKCWKWSGHGMVSNAVYAIESSCNDYLCDISYGLGMNGNSYSEAKAIKTLEDYSILFDLDKKTGIEIAESSPHISNSYAIPSAIGQGKHNYSTVQLARYVNTLANRGISYQLSLVDKIVDSNLEANRTASVIESNIKLSDTVWNTVSSGMLLLAENNRTLNNLGIKVAGKTGTAQESKKRPDHALFVGYAPYENPEISVSIRIANGYASGNAVGVASDIFNYYFELIDKEDILTGTASHATNVRTD